ncbi:ribosomal protein S6 [Cladorrhinum sp. PSN332]|nr:ribosomal protein S6 [Cladorrhinum sp. PSN332]
MLYETIGIIRHNPSNLAEVKEIVLAAGQMILQRGGVIRDIANWGVFALPRAVSKNQQRHTRGHYFVMRYDCGIQANEAVRQTLSIDPRVIRATNVKLGDGKLERLSRFGKIEWRKMEG